MKGDTKGTLTRNTIVRHALDMASLFGLEGISIGKLAAELKLSKSGLFAHFRSKEELQIQILVAAAEEFKQVVSDPVRAKATARESLELLYDRWTSWGLDNKRFPGGCVFVAAAFEKDDQPGVVRERLAELQKTWVGFLARLARKASDEGYFAAGADAEAFAQEVYGVMLGLSFFHRLLSDRQAEPRARRTYESLLARYQGQPASSRGSRVSSTV